MVASATEPTERLSEAEYLVFEAGSRTKHEYVLGWVRALAGAAESHNLIVTNLIVELGLAVRGKGCRVFGSDMRLRVSSELYYYPDVMVVCDPGDVEPLDKTRPCLIVEVVSPSTASIDRGEKLLGYRGIASLHGYVVVACDERRVERHWRRPPGAWQREDLVNAGTVSIPCLDVSLPLDAIYRGVSEEGH